MNESIKKARADAATSEQAVGSDFLGHDSRIDCTTNKKARQSGPVSSLLLYGETNAILGKDLTNILGLNNLRELTKLVERERRAGIPICAAVSGDDRGYFLADSPAELERYLKSLDRRLKNVRETREACQDTLCRMTGQEKIRR